MHNTNRLASTTRQQLRRLHGVFDLPSIHVLLRQLSDLIIFQRAWVSRMISEVAPDVSPSFCVQLGIVERDVYARFESHVKARDAIGRQDQNSLEVLNHAEKSYECQPLRLRHEHCATHQRQSCS